MRNANQLKATGQRLLDIALKKGADAVHVDAGSQMLDDIGLEKNDYQLSRSNSSQSISLTVHKDSKKGSAQSNDLSDAGLEKLADLALTIAASAVKDDKLAFSRPGEVVELPLKDEKLTSLTSTELIDIANEIFRESFADPLLTIDGGKLNRTFSISCIINSNGVVLSRESTILSGFLMAMGMNNGQVTSFDYDDFTSRSLDDFVDEAKIVFHELGNELKSMFNPEKSESYKGPIILRPEVVSDLLLQVVMFHAHGDSMKDNASRWSDNLDKQVASPLFSLKDDPHNLDFIGAAGYDRSGTPTKPATLIESGVLKFNMESVDSASRRGANPTGHEGGCHVPRIVGGDDKIIDLAKAAGRPVLSVRRFSGNVNTITGDFSGVAKNSHLIKDGESIPMIETMISGNVFEMLNQIIAVGKAINHRSKLEVGPFLVDGVSVSTGS